MTVRVLLRLCLQGSMAGQYGSGKLARQHETRQKILTVAHKMQRAPVQQTALLEDMLV
jgi:hypothetical protein